MAEPTVWTTIVSSAVSTIIAIGTVIATRERSNGSDHSTLMGCAEDVKALKLTSANQAATMAQHNILHDRMGDWQDKIEDRVEGLSKQVNQAIGREDGRRHQQR